MQAAVEAVGSIDDQPKLADWLRERGRHDPRPAELERDGSPKGEFLVGQWQGGKPEIVLPEDAATSRHDHRGAGLGVGVVTAAAQRGGRPPAGAAAVRI